MGSEKQRLTFQNRIAGGDSTGTLGEDVESGVSVPVSGAWGTHPSRRAI